MAEGGLLDVKVDKAELDHLVAVLEAIPNGAAKALASAINKTTSHGKTEIKRKLSAELAVKKGVIGRHVYVDKATKSKQVSTIKIKSRPVNLIAFYARQNSSGVVAKLAGQSKQFPHDFISPGLGGSPLVFERAGAKRTMRKGRYKGKMRQPIVAVPGMSAQELYQRTPGIAKAVLKDLGETLSKNIKSQISRLLADPKGASGDE